MQKSHEYIQALEEERRKIQVFRRELPLCLELVTLAIDACRRQLSGSEQSQCSEQTSSENGGPVFEEFIPIKRTSSSDDDRSNKSEEDNNDSVKKLDWLRSAQLWNQAPDPTMEEEEEEEEVVEVSRNSGGAFRPYKGEENVGRVPEKSKRRSCSPAEDVDPTMNPHSQKRKARRCWSPELHRRFLDALQQLGSSDVATPKQIRMLMKVDGLTNDEVKSHLQKYRLHARRPTLSSNQHNTSTSTSNSNGNPQAQPTQFLVVGGIWVPPPPEYVAPAASGVITSPTVYAPVAALPPALAAPANKKTRHYSHSDHHDKSCCSATECRLVHSNNSPANSSFITGSPVY